MARAPAELIQLLSSWFYRMDRRDDGMWHLKRDEATAHFANGIVIAAGGNWTTPADLRTVASQGIPADSKGAIFWVLMAGNAVATDLYVAPGGVVAGTWGKRVGRCPVAGVYTVNAVCACLFGLTAGVPNGLLTFNSVGGQSTFYAACIGYIA